MAGGIKAVIATQFDATGLNKATKEFGKLGSSLKSTLGAVGLAVGLAAITSGLKEAAKAASDDAKSQLLLAQQMKNSTGATDAQIASTEDMIGKLSIMSAVADDQLRPALSSLVRATGDVSKAQGLLALSLDVSAATGKDLNAVSLAIGKAVSGQTQALFRMIPGLKGSSDWMAKLKSETAGAAQVAGDADPFMRLTIIFDEIQEQIGSALLPAMQELATWLASDTGQAEIAGLVNMFKDLAKAVGNVIIWLKDNYKAVIAVGTTIATVAALATAFEAVATAIQIAKAAQVAFSLAMNANPIWLAVTAITALVVALGLLNNAVGTTNPNLMGQNVPKAIEKAASAAGTAAALEYRKKNPQDIQGAIEANKAATQAFINRWKAGQAEIARAAAAKKAAADKALADQLNDLKNAPTTPTSPSAPAKVKAVVSSAAAAAAKLAAEAKQAFEDMKVAVDDFNRSFDKTAQEFEAVFKTGAALGEFEQQAVDSFEAIKQSAQDAFDSELITKDALASLNAYADSEKVLLQGIAKQRDVLAKKISIAQSVTSGVMGSLNITSMLESETKQVTKSVTSMVNGIALTTTQTFDEVVSGGLANSFKKLVEKTKTFAANLIKLKELGLNGNLFKQIVDAGAEGGNATAEAIIAGGASAVTELNGLFKELTDAGSSIAETATPVMYDLGDEMTNSFIDGLRSEDQKLIDTATAMAALFTESFKSALGSAMLPALNTSALAAGLGMDNTDYIRGVGRVTSSGTNPTGGAITINVNAGMIASKQEIPQMVVDALGTYTKQSGAGGLTRILGL